jgi:starvation-inducible DNA-binding protein
MPLFNVPATAESAPAELSPAVPALVPAEKPVETPAEVPAASSDVLSFWHAVFHAVYSAYYTAQVGHWHIVDPKFNDVHAFFQAEYEELAKTVDTVAEHIRTLKGMLPSNLSKLATGDTLQPVETDSAKALLENYLQAIGIAGKLINKVAEEVDGRGVADEDLRGELARQFAKSTWKLESMLKARVEASTASKA